MESLSNDTGGWILDPADHIEFEDRSEILRSLGRVMDDEPADDETAELNRFHEAWDRWGNE